MTITPAAAEVIRRFSGGANLRHPVICLAEVSDVSPSVAQAVSRGENQAAIRSAFAHSVPERRYLYPLVYPRSHFLWLTTTIDGFSFAAMFFHPSIARGALKSGVLDAAERGLVLRDRNGCVVLPQEEGLNGREHR